MSLREDLANRLSSIYNQSDDADFWTVADECIRQMEWAWANGFDSCCNRGQLKRLEKETMTIAPPDWKPE